MEELVTYEIKDRVAYVTLNRPEKRNALSFEFVGVIKESIQKAIADANCKVLVIRGNGEAFCSGADLASLQQLQNNTFEENIADSTHLAELFLLIYHSPKVVISLVHGAAFAGGCGLATICDFCFAESHARFAYTEVKIGFIPAIVLVFLLRQIGERKARQILLSGEILDALQAKELGLINYVVDSSLIHETVHEYAVKLAKQTSAQSIASTKKMLANVPEKSLEEAIKYAAEMNANARSSEDCKKGIAAFLNKEKISW